MNWFRGDSDSILRTAESLAEDADPHPFSRWIAGVIFAAAVAALGLAHVVAATGWAPLRWLFALWHVRDPEVIAGVGGFLVAIAVFMHAHFFWTPDARWHVVGQVGKSVAAITIVVLLLVAVIGGFAGMFDPPWLFRHR